MTKYLLSQWEAVELFCKVVSVYENLVGKARQEKGGESYTYVNIGMFSDNNYLMQSLRKYENPTYYRHFGDTYMKEIALKEGIPRHYPKALYDLSLEIRYSQPVVRTLDELLLLLIFIGERASIDQYRPLLLWQPNDRQRTFENTRWWLYYYEEYYDSQLDTKEQGVTRAVVQLKPFAKLVIFNIDASDGSLGKEEKYIGSYRVYGGPKGQYLLLEAKLSNNQTRDLHILIHVGDNDFRPGEIAIGQYHNNNNTIYSGTVIMEMVSQRGSLGPKFFKKDDPTIHSTYWSFFNDKYKNRIRVKSGIRSKGGLQNWLNTKKRKK